MKKGIGIILLTTIGVILLGLGTSYALFTYNVTKNKDFKVVVGNLELSIEDAETDDVFIMEYVVPTKDKIALEQKGYEFTVRNTGSIESFYVIYLDDIFLEEEVERLKNSDIKVNLTNHKTEESITKKLDEERVLELGYLKPGEENTYTLRMWVDYEVGNEAQNKYYATQIRVEGEQTNIKRYEDVKSVVSSFPEEKLKETIMCDTLEGNQKMYYNCKIYDTIEEALKSRTKGEIIVTKDITKTSSITIDKSKNIVLDLNEKTITTEEKVDLFTVNGTMNMRNGEITSNGTAITVGNTGNVEVSNTRVISNISAICTNGKLVVNERTEIEGTWGIGCHMSNNAMTIINGGTIRGNTNDGIALNKSYSTKLLVNGGVIIGNRNGIYLEGEGTIHIHQTEKPIYISSLAKTWNPAIRNASTGTININAHEANQCTSNPEDTTSGLCVYAEGDKKPNSNTGNGALDNRGDGTVNINGGTFYGLHQGINNHANGIINISNISVFSSWTAILNNQTGTINICNGKIDSNANYDLYNNPTGGTINYSTNVTFQNRENNIPKVAGDGQSNIIPNYTGKCYENNMS